ncbi:MAG: hypothetical protein UW44_C0013G0004 [Candidatus Collierbacteria bacterium GW2011_GWB2_44_22]|uniref:Uncharacterized protein n=1 Tax=Candidatus Collierbacteria bacterium GW2011_GWB2_44_22 TaxID=1618387 RepID=A0A0G1KTQ9_9BACT|nr:MAG: hypothetical protein UW44_C0013G0004 [Candidatus Collierbacteria bacterium GW2011_GWB2_44_22]
MVKRTPLSANHIFGLYPSKLCLWYLAGELDFLVVTASHLSSLLSYSST